MRRAGALLISIAALAYAVAVVIVSWQAPDKGFLTFRGRRVTIVEPGSEAERAGVRRGDVVVAVDGDPIESTLEYADRLLGRRPGERVTVEVERGGQGDGVGRLPARIVLRGSPVPLGAIAAVVMALILLALGLLALWTRPGDLAADRFWRTCVVFAVIYAGALSWVHLVVHPTLALIALAALFAAPPVSHDFTTVFPSPLPRARGSRFAVWAISALIGAGTFAAVALAARARAAGEPGDVWLDWVTRGIAAELALYVVVVSIGIAIGGRRVREATGTEKSQHKWLRFGGALAAIPAFAAIPFALADLDRFLIEGYRPFAAALAVLGFATTSLAVLRVRLADVDAVIHRSVTYVIATGGAALVYVGVALGVGAGVERLGATPLAAHLIAALVAAGLFGPIRDRVQPWLDRRFFRDRLHYVHALRELAETMVAIRDPVELARAVVDRTVTALRAGSGALYLARQGEGEQRLAHAHGEGWAERAAAPEPPVDGVATPVARDGKSFGTLVLGPRLGGDLYSTEDRALLGALAGQLAVAIENAGAFQTITAMTATLAEQNREIRELRDKLEDENRYLRSRIEQALGEDGALVVGGSARARELLRQIERVAPTDAVVLLQGETGSGKGVAARMIHAGSERAAGPFIHVDCGAIPAGVFESELFGHERGAFTGAVRARRGFFELADGGTLFLDEIGELPLPLQPKLLRVLQEREVTRVGGSKPLSVDVRIVAATNRSLADMVRRGELREDLYYRLGVVEIEVPPLRARRTDIPDLIDVLLPRICRKNRRQDLELTDEALARMQAYGWPGNVRELENVLERAVVLAEGRELRAEDLNLPDAPPQVEELRERASDLPPDAGHRDVMETLEKDRLVAALRAAGGNQSHAARSLGMPRTTLINKMRRYGLG